MHFVYMQHEVRPFGQKGCTLGYINIYNGGVGFYHALITIGFPRTATNKGKTSGRTPTPFLVNSGYVE